ncbi:MAG: DUF1572 family protein [Fibrobacteria bacterium]|nr:DUF1572 family protein [Fibrobacteria bacterium]
MNIHESIIIESINTIDNAYGRITHCTNQLDDSHIWHRLDENVNSIGIIIQHLCGNLRQWVYAGIGNKKDVRNRPLEFKDNEKKCKIDLIEMFAQTIEECKTTIRQIKYDNLLAPRRIQGFEGTILSAMFDTIPHLELHAGQIVFITRMILKENFELRWKPLTKEEGTE